MFDYKLQSIVQKLRHRSVDFDLEPYRKLSEQVNSHDFSNMKDQELKEASRELISRAAEGEELNGLMVEAYAIVREAAFRVLGMKPFDVQIMAAIALNSGRLVEMQTGEGKTLAAVMPAYLNALTGKGVHVLTFNDYLARRDAEWMGPVYEFLGLTTGFIGEGMSTEERRRAYSCDITYLTAKEAGFDYLKAFLCQDSRELVQRPFNFAIVDEADSILIDEARIPLVIAGSQERKGPGPVRLAKLVKGLKPGEDYDLDEYERNVFLTDRGVSLVEKTLECGNLYAEENLQLLVDVNNALHAEALFKRDVDYIVRNGRIELVDEFTGRVADRRQWPYGLQQAIEAKEGLTAESNGQIIASVTLQNFIRQYPRIGGMTGTAFTSADEFNEFYGLRVVVLPTNRPCIRKDHPDVIFTHKKAKFNALIAEVAKVHSKRRPILIGTCSVEESEKLAARLLESGIGCQVLNARNDREEAQIIARAGEPGAVTVSTNMAGRGTDIRLGGIYEARRDEVVRLGGLYVIGTNRHESRRIDNQLRGRAGRQGDPGSSRFFISLEDDLMTRYKLKELIPEAIYPGKQAEPLNNRLVTGEIARAQRIIEGQNFDIRKTLDRYSVIIERQWQIIYRWRRDILLDLTLPGIFPGRLGARYNELYSQYGCETVAKSEKQISLYFITRCWTDYLDYVSYLRESIHLVNLAGKVPLDEFNRTVILAFEKLKAEILDEIERTLAVVEITREGVDMDKAGLKAPSSTWTYLINDRPEQLGLNPVCRNPVAAAVSLPLWAGAALYYRVRKKVRKLG